MTRIISLDKNWKFCPGEARRWDDVPHMLCYDMTKAGRELGVMDIFLNRNEWQDIRLPHDWNTREAADPEKGICNNGYKKRGVGWYFLRFDMPAFSGDETVLLEFEGVMGESLVYVNGARALRNHSGYNGFYADISGYLIPETENMIAVRVDTSSWEGWWYEGAGIYRPVKLMIRPPMHFKHLSPFVLPKHVDGKWFVDVSAAVENSSEQGEACSVKVCLEDAEGNQIASCRLESKEISAMDEAAFSGRLEAGNVTLWDLDHPVLYRAVFTILLSDGTCSDTVSVRCGFREIEWTSDRGMLLNGKTVRVNGICCHQDHAGVGIAADRTVLRYRIRQLKAMGCNAYRCAHHMPWEYLLEVCDELGMLVMDENRHFNTMEETMLQIDDMVLRARNHPSVFLYCLFNEEYWQDEPRGYRIARALAGRVRNLDSSRAITAAMNGGVLTEKNASDVTDVAGMNYYIRDYGHFAERCPGKPLIGTENGPIFCTRGESDYDSEKQVFGGYGDRTSESGELIGETMDAAAGAPFCAGVFLWGGFDYRGEPYPFTWPSVSSHWGFNDLCGFRKDTSYLLESYYSEKPVLHITPHWNQSEGQCVRVCVFSNAEHVELMLNNKSQGIKQTDHCRAEWMVPYVPGELRAEARMKDGSMITACMRTAGEPVMLQTETESGTEEDSVLINIRLLDREGTLVPTDDRTVYIQPEKGEIIGVGNGDPNAALQPDVCDHIPTFHGMAQVIARRAGGLRIRLSADGLPECRILIG